MREHLDKGSETSETGLLGRKGSGNLCMTQIQVEGEWWEIFHLENGDYGSYMYVSLPPKCLPK